MARQLRCAARELGQAVAAHDGLIRMIYGWERGDHALSEIMVAHEFTGQGIAHALHDELLRGRPEKRATLLAEPDNTRAYRAYLRWGWQRVSSLRPAWPDAPTFDVLMLALPR